MYVNLKKTANIFIYLESFSFFFLQGISKSVVESFSIKKISFPSKWCTITCDPLVQH